MPQPKAPPARLLMHGLFAALLAVSTFGCGGCGTPPECGDTGCADGGGTQTGATALLMGSITGYVGTGLVLETATDFTSPVSGSVAFAFANKLPLGTPYTIGVRTQPTAPAQTCVVENASGTVSDRASNAAVVCTTDVYPVTVSVTGLAGPGLLLRNNGGDDLSVPLPAGGGPTTATFAVPLRSGAAYNVTVAASPTGQTCTVMGGTGTVVAGPITSVSVNCVISAYAIGGTVTGLAGTGLVLQNNGGGDLIVNANGTFAFATPQLTGTAYAVTVLSQPTAPWQTCTLANASGTVGSVNVIGVTITCATNRYPVSVTVSGLSGSGLVLQNNGGDDLSVTGNGAAAFATTVVSGGAYAVTVLTQPTGPAQTCVLSSGAGTVAGAPVTVSITCSTASYTVGGTVTGLLGGTLVLQNNGGDALTLTADGAFTFATPLLSGSTYSVTVFAQPTGPSQTCSLSNRTGTVGAAPVTTVTVACAVTTYPVNVSVTGLSGSGLSLRNNGGDTLAVPANGTRAFATPIASGGAYAVTVFAQPTSPWQTCAVTGGSGTVAGASPTVAVACTTNRYTVGGTVTGLTTPGLVLQNSGGDNLTLSASGGFTFATTVASGAAYAVTRLTNPAGLNCTVTSGTGTVAGANITSVVVACTNMPPPTGTVTFNYTGSMATFTVPALVTQVTLNVCGSQGNRNAASVVGGLGGCAVGTRAVTPGQVLNIFVGGGAATSTAAGYNGGGAAGLGACVTARGGGGGGASDVRIGGTALSNRVIVGAGGGGAAGNRVTGCGRGSGGGGGGGYFGGGGGAAWPNTSTVVPTGGTQSAGGAAGISNFAATLPGANGTAGSSGTGGTGGVEVSGNQAGNFTGSTGAVGGGATGGNGTHAGTFTGQSGAGGSGYVGGVTGGTLTSGARTGTGRVIVSY